MLNRHGVGKDGWRRWTVDMPDVSYVGKILAPPDWGHERIVTYLNDWASKTSPGIVMARIYSATRLQ